MRVLAIFSVDNAVKQFLVFTFLVLAFCFLLWCIFAFVDIKSTTQKIVSTSLLIISVLSLICTLVMLPDKKQNEYKYYVEITDMDNKDEILSDYIVESIMGNIFVIKDK